MLVHVACNGISVPGYSFVYFLFLSALLWVTAIFYTPFRFGVTADFYSIIKEYAKLAVVFLYFLIGYNLNHEDLIKSSIKWYSFAALFVGTLGIFINLLGLKFFYQIYDFGEDRYNGFMNDPNYFAIVQISALPFFLRSEKMLLRTKLITYLIILISILLSGSKTGIITLLIYTTIFSLGEIVKNKLKLRTIILMLFGILLLGVLLELLGKNLTLLTEKSVQFQRISLIFTDFNAAFNEGGSSRLPIWKAGIELIGLSPLVGVGVGMYTAVSEKVSGIDAVAHNTYIQTFSEWGGIFAAIFFLYIACIILKITVNKQFQSKITYMLRDILIILLIGSMAVSFNNARMFWFFLGSLVYLLSSKNLGKVSGRFS
ncbi:O-antigen ligase family protein [Neobacillus drentensis]|uniref:O-antigen ligase family protein n=1 Tax=Neobacillus drentensis TaxID=220684 RepID=UPI002FFE221A